MIKARSCTKKSTGKMKSVAILLLSLVSAAAFMLGNRPSFLTSRVLRTVPVDNPGESLVEWTGAKKFSLKDRAVETILSSEQISKILPHRYPFLLVDRVVEFEPGKRAVGVKCVTANEPQFTGHFPDRPIMPGVLMIEAMAQLGRSPISCLEIGQSHLPAVFLQVVLSAYRPRSTTTEMGVFSSLRESVVCAGRAPSLLVTSWLWR